MALSFTIGFVICISVIIPITVCKHVHVERNILTSGNYVMKPINWERCRVQIRCDGIKLINTGINIMYPDIKIKGRYYDAVKELH